MNTKRYANDFIKAGYIIDSYSLKMNGRVTEIYIKGEKDISISAPSYNELKIATYLERDKSIALFTRYNSSMKKISSDIIRSHEKENVVVSDEEIKTYEKDGLKKANKLTKDLYQKLYN
ncbi:hypothetical protein QUF99_05330 [Bacillus sp. DX4.1]|uniref:hypothetical protein n=1 Tax=Bacillus sp. DX4.1 TaxID=3055867 RepID=UPI0025A101D3|nr:hypothetical protein [Bacillus sp. DX4.1]MDM5186795.1 hypothetical protein [Bacillus sp. DX4.1]